MDNIKKLITFGSFVVIMVISTVSLGQVRVSGSAHVHVPVPVVAPAPPTMVFVGPGVWVIEDYNEPVFYHDDYYWSYRHGVWFRSHVHTGGWVRAHAVPPHLHRIKRPGRYVRYHGPKAHKRRRVVVRKHGPHRSHAPAVSKRHRSHGHVTSHPTRHRSSVKRSSKHRNSSPKRHSKSRSRHRSRRR